MCWARFGWRYHDTRAGMNSTLRCPITYQLVTPPDHYSKAGLKILSPRLTDLSPLTLNAEQLRREAQQRADKMSIQGVQPKLSANLDITNHCFKLVDRGGHYILKPPSELYAELPQNEDLTMRLAACATIPVPLHGLLFNADQSFTYFIKRFDRGPKQQKYACEDFAQLSGSTRDTKYNSSMEKVAKIIELYCTFPEVEKKQLFLRVLFNYLIGNEDMHLKNFSLLTMNNKIQLAPAYDYLNSTIALGNVQEEIALPLHGKKRNLKRSDFINYYAGEILGLNTNVVQIVLNTIQSQFSQWRELIDASFMSRSMQQAYLKVLTQRIQQLAL